jgi:hypothetical protein
MAGRKGNAAEGIPLTITLSRQSVDALTQIAGRGLYGRNVPEVAARFVDRTLQDMVQFPPIILKTEQIPEG